MACRDIGGLISGLVLIDALGVLVPAEPMPNFFALTPRAMAEHSHFDPDRFFLDPATLPPERLCDDADQRRHPEVPGGGSLHAPPEASPAPRRVMIPALAIWGDSDRVATPADGRVFASAFPDGRFELIEKAGHLPQIEQPEATAASVERFIASIDRR